MSRTTRFLWGAGLGYLNFALATLIGLWLTRYLLGELGPETMGLWVQFLQVVAMLGILDLGVLVLLPREVATTTGPRTNGWENATDLPEVIGRYATLALRQTVLVAVGAGVGWSLLTLSEPEAAGPLAVLFGSYTLLFPLRSGAAVLQGLQDSRFIGLMQTVGFLVGTLTVIGLVWAGAGLYALTLGWVANQGLLLLLIGCRVWVRFKAVLPARLPSVPWPVARPILISGLWASMASVGTMLVGNTDALAIGRFHPPEEVLQYAFTAKLPVVLGTLVLTLCTAVMPGLAEVRAGGDPVRTTRVLSAYYQTIMLYSGWVVCLVLMTNSGFVTWWVGPKYNMGLEVTGLMAAGMMLRHWINALAITMFTAHKERLLWALCLVDGFVVAGGIFALASIGPRWVPLAVLIGSGGVFVPVALTVLGRTGVYPLKTQAAALGWWAIRFALVGGLVIAVRSVWFPSGFLEIVAAGLAITIVYTAVMLPAARRQAVGDYLHGPLRFLRLA